MNTERTRTREAVKTGKNVLTFLIGDVGCYVWDSDLFAFLDVPCGGENEAEAIGIPFPSGVGVAATKTSGINKNEGGTRSITYLWLHLLV